MREASPVPLQFFCAIQTDGQTLGDGPIGYEFTALLDRMIEIGGDSEFWTFHVGGWKATTRHRLIGITMGRNLIREFALRDTDATHVLFLDTDLKPDPECIPKLLELDHPVVGGDVPHYCLSGRSVRCSSDHISAKACNPNFGGGCRSFGFYVQEHWNTAGFLLVRRDVLAQVAWRWDPTSDPPITDDPSFATDVERAGFGKTWVRKDCVGQHPPLIPVEERRR
jgi:hypothetical protein